MSVIVLVDVSVVGPTDVVIEAVCGIPSALFV